MLTDARLEFGSGVFGGGRHCASVRVVSFEGAVGIAETSAALGACLLALARAPISSRTFKGRLLRTARPGVRLGVVRQLFTPENADPDVTAP